MKNYVNIITNSDGTNLLEVYLENAETSRMYYSITYKYDVRASQHDYGLFSDYESGSVAPSNGIHKINYSPPLKNNMEFLFYNESTDESITRNINFEDDKAESENLALIAADALYIDGENVPGPNFIVLAQNNDLLSSSTMKILAGNKVVGWSIGKKMIKIVNRNSTDEAHVYSGLLFTKFYWLNETYKPTSPRTYNIMLTPKTNNGSSKNLVAEITLSSVSATSPRPDIYELEPWMEFYSE